MSFYFTLDDIYNERINARMHAHRFERMHAVKLENIKQLCGRLPEENECFFIETTKSFNAFTFIVYLIRHAGHIEQLFIATYSINDRIINSLLKWKEKGLIDNVCIEISESIKFRMPKVSMRLDDLQSKGIISVIYEWTHRKVTCVKTPVGYFEIEGSGNYGENALKEQYLFCKSKEIYEFRNNEISSLG